MEHHANPGPEDNGINIIVIDIHPIQLDFPRHAADFDGIVHAVETAQIGGLATSGRADQGDDFLFGNVEVDVENRLLFSIENIDVAGCNPRIRHRVIPHGMFAGIFLK